MQKNAILTEIVLTADSMCVFLQQVFVMLIILQGINHFQEAILPLVLRKAYTAVRNIIIYKAYYSGKKSIFANYYLLLQFALKRVGTIF